MSRKTPATPVVAISPRISAASGSPSRLVLVGRFGAPHGLRGEARLQSFTADPMAIASYGALTDAGGVRRYDITSLRPAGKGMFVARVAGVADRDAAEALTNIELYLERTKLPPEEEDEFYLADLIGLAAFTAAGERLGEVLGVVNFGAGDIIEIKPEVGETLLFPFTKVVAPTVDLAAGKVIVAPPEIEAEQPNGDVE